MHFRSLVVRAASALVVLPFTSGAQTVATTTVSGTLYDAAVGRPLSGAYVSFQGARDTVRTDGNGRYRLSVPRTASVLIVWREGYQDLKVPDTKLTTEQLRADIELRTDPPPRTETASGQVVVPMLWIVRDAPDTLRVLDSSRYLVYPQSSYAISHGGSNPPNGFKYGLAGSFGVTLAVKK